MIDVLELAKQADAVSIDVNGDRKKASERLEHFAKLVIEAHNKELLEGGNKSETDSNPMELVLIDGVEYNVPLPVAVELLRLHMELQARSHKIIRDRARYKDILQAITDEENQPSQYGTITLSMHEAAIDAAVLREREKHSELLEALLDCLECEFPVSEKAVIEKARTAIAKYKGESK